MTTWILAIYMGITWAGVGAARHVEFPDKDSCFESLEAMRVTGQMQSGGEDDEQTVAFCYPAPTDLESKP